MREWRLDKDTCNYTCYDTEEDICKQLTDKSFIISGKIEIDRLNEEFNLEIPEGEYETIAGFITSELGFIPTIKKEYSAGNYKIEIIHSSKQKIELVKLKLNQND